MTQLSSSTSPRPSINNQSRKLRKCKPRTQALTICSLTLLDKHTAMLVTSLECPALHRWTRERTKLLEQVLQTLKRLKLKSRETKNTGNTSSGKFSTSWCSWSPSLMDFFISICKTMQQNTQTMKDKTHADFQGRINFLKSKTHISSRRHR